jgi:hypothetical protein
MTGRIYIYFLHWTNVSPETITSNTTARSTTPNVTKCELSQQTTPHATYRLQYKTRTTVRLFTDQKLVAVHTQKQRFPRANGRRKRSLV